MHDSAVGRCAGAAMVILAVVALTAAPAAAKQVPAGDVCLGFAPQGERTLLQVVVKTPGDFTQVTINAPSSRPGVTSSFSVPLRREGDVHVGEALIGSGPTRGHGRYSVAHLSGAGGGMTPVDSEGTAVDHAGEAKPCPGYVELEGTSSGEGSDEDDDTSASTGSAGGGSDESDGGVPVAAVIAGLVAVVGLLAFGVARRNSAKRQGPSDDDYRRMGIDPNDPYREGKYAYLTRTPEQVEEDERLDGDPPGEDDAAPEPEHELDRPGTMLDMDPTPPPSQPTGDDEVM